MQTYAFWPFGLRINIMRVEMYKNMRILFVYSIRQYALTEYCANLFISININKYRT